MSAVPTSTMAASSRIAGEATLTRWTATGDDAPTAASSLDAGAASVDPDSAAHIVSVSVTSCLRITLTFLPRLPVAFSPFLVVLERDEEA